MNYSSLGSESTQKYQMVNANSNRIVAYHGGTIFQVVQQNKGFKITTKLPYDISLAKEESYIKQNQVMLGSGSFATVYQSLNIKRELICALKVHLNFKEMELLPIVNEYAIQLKLNSKFPIQFIELIDKIYIMQEDRISFSCYAGIEQGITSLEEYLKGRTLENYEFQCLYHEILDQILKMHSIHIAHRDIKPSNILYLMRNKWVLGDFGCSTIYQNQKGIYNIAGTKPYLPKNIRNKLNNRALEFEMEMDLFQNDIYAFTLTMLQAYKKDINIVDLQNMIDQSNWNNIQDDSLQYLFQIYQKPYTFIKSRILLYLNHVKIDQKIEEQFIQKLQNQKRLIDSNYKLERLIKQLRFDYDFRNDMLKMQYNDDLKNYLPLGSYFDELEIDFTEKFKKYIPIFQLKFISIDEKQYQQIFQIDKNTKKWQFEIIMFYHQRKGNFTQSLQFCHQFQKFSEKNFIELKLIEIDRLMFIGQEQNAYQKIQELEQISFQLTEETSLFYNFFQFLKSNTWLYQSQNLFPFIIHSNDIKKIYIFFNNTMIIKNGFSVKKIIHNQGLEQEFQSIHQLQNMFEQICAWFGILKSPTNQIIDHLYARGADCYGIYYIFYHLISASIYDCNHQLIKDLHLQLINFIESNKQLQHFFWLILLNYSIYCFTSQKFEESLQYLLRARGQVQNDDQENKIIINFQIYYSLLKLFKYQKAKKLFNELLINVNSLQLGNFKIELVKKLIQGTKIIYDQGNFTDLQYCLQLFRTTFQKNTDKTIQSFLYKFEWEVFLALHNYDHLQNQLNNQMINLNMNSTLSDIELLKLIQNIKVIARKNQFQSYDAQGVFLKYQKKLMQDLVIYEDLSPFDQTETLHPESEIVKYYCFCNLDESECFEIIDKLQYFS